MIWITDAFRNFKIKKRLATEKEDLCSNLILWFRVAVWGAVLVAVLFFTAETGIYNKVYCAISGKLGHKPGQSGGAFFGGFGKRITENIKFELNRTVD